MTAPEATSWRTPLETHRSRGSQAPRPGSLAGLAQARRQTWGQYFTPSSIVTLLWQLLAPAAARSTQARRIHLIDTSCATGALFAGATPDAFALAGFDVDEAAVAALTEHAEAAGFVTDLCVGSLADARIADFDWALINPPYSLTLSSPNLEPLPSTSWGRFGPNTSALSHPYAVDQALAGARAVLAILPTGYAQTRASGHGSDRLHALLRLPRGAFREEGTEVDTTLAVFADARDGGAAVMYGELDAHTATAWGERLADALAITHAWATPTLRMQGQETRQTITLPVTGNTTCRVYRSGRRIQLGFTCGLAQARGLNAVLRERVPAIEGHRYPAARRAFLPTLTPELYVGQGPLDVEVLLAQPDPLATFEALLGVLREAGLTPKVDAALRPYLIRRIRRLAVETTPLRRFIWTAGGTGEQVTGRAKATHLERALDFRSPRVEAGEVLTFRRTQDARGAITYEATLADGRLYRVDDQALERRFTLGDAPPSWRLIHPGRLEAFPARAAAVRRRAEAAGVDRILWDFQLHDAIEHAMATGDTCGMAMGCGKSRVAASLCLMGGKHNAIIVPAHLAEEITDELQACGLPRDLWQVLRRADQPLRRINVIAITTLRAPIVAGAGRRTLARALRRAFHTVVVDEAHTLKTADTLQTRAIWALSPKRRYAMTGSLIDYPRNALRVQQWTAGDGTARQPYGVHSQLYLEPRLAASMAACARGIERFAEDFVSTEWVTNEFADSLQEGAAREIPRIRSPERYRAWLGPALKRRVMGEPEVAAHVLHIAHTARLQVCHWDPEHWSFYLGVAEEFAAWYRRTREAAGVAGRRLNLPILLARIGAVTLASNAPHRPIGDMGSYSPLTSKHRAALDLMAQWTREGRKSICFDTHPDVLDRLADALAERGIEAVRYHGRIPIRARTRELNRRFRKGDAPVLLASIGAAQTGLNLPMASRSVHPSRTWSAIAEAQCVARMLRPQQREAVESVFLELEGGIDAYMRQVSAFKKDAAAVGIDYQDSLLDDVPFEHLETILGRFARDYANRRAA